MRIDLTDLSYQAFEQLSNPATTSFHASEYLQSRLQIREFYPTLTKMYSGNDLMERLLHAFTEAKPALSSASISRNLRNWTNKKTVPQFELSNLRNCYSYPLQSPTAGAFTT